MLLEIVAGKMRDRNLEQRTIIKFLFKSGKSATEILEMSINVYGSATMSRARVFEWCKRFRKRRESLSDDEKSGRPRTSLTAVNSEKVREMMLADRRVSVRYIAEQLDMNRESVRSIIRNEMHMTKVCSRMVPRILTDDQKQYRVQVCESIKSKITNTPDYLNYVITGDETWVFQYDPETKRQSIQWKRSTSPRVKQARMARSQLKTMLIVFFDFRGIVHYEFIPPKTTMNQTV